MEKLIRGENEDDKTFFGQVVGPVYKFRTQGDENTFLWTTLIALWLITLWKLHSTNFRHLRTELGDPRRAREMFSRALAVDPEHAESLEALKQLPA
jgi:hypothetical protein